MSARTCDPSTPTGQRSGCTVSNGYCAYRPNLQYHQLGSCTVWYIVNDRLKRLLYLITIPSRSPRALDGTPRKSSGNKWDIRGSSLCQDTIVLLIIHGMTLIESFRVPALVIVIVISRQHPTDARRPRGTINYECKYRLPS